MNTLQIKHILQTNPVTKKSFNGVYPKDLLMSIDKPKLIICNTDTSEGEGKHWILIFFNNNEVDFFDSLGNNPSYYGNEFIDFMKKYVSECNITQSRVQPLNSDLCGHYCCYYAHKRCQGYNMEYIINNFPSPQIVKQFSEVYLKNYVKENNEDCMYCMKY